MTSFGQAHLGDSHSGACQRHDFLWLLLKACIETGFAPQFDGPVNVIPVDYASKAIVTCRLAAFVRTDIPLANGASVAGSRSSRCSVATGISFSCPFRNVV